MKTCTKCKTEKDESEFNKHRRTGLQPWCRTCTTAAAREWYEKNKDRHCEYVATRADRKTHACSHCGLGEPEVSFYRRKDSRVGTPRFICRACDALYKKNYPSNFSEETKRRRSEDQKSQERKRRGSPENFARYTFRDLKDIDRARGRDNDLTLVFVEELISRGCTYCGTKDYRITLDRIDNTLGHTKANVNPSCRTCNWIRRDMPYVAWIRFITVLHEIRKDRLWGDWHCGPKNHPR